MDRRTIRARYAFCACNGNVALQCQFALLFMLLASLAFPQNVVEQAPVDKVFVSKITTLMDDAGQRRNVPLSICSLAWHPDGKSLAIDLKGVNGYYAVAQLVPFSEGSSRIRTLTDRRVRDDTRFNNGNPRWMPAGEGIVFSGQCVELPEIRRTYPGNGFACNLFYGDREGREFWRLTDIHGGRNTARGCTMPVISQDGKALFWTDCRQAKGERLQWGRRSIKKASLAIENGVPNLGRVRDITPSELKDEYLETTDCKAGMLLYSAGSYRKGWYVMDVYVQDVSKDGVEQPRNLTNDSESMDRFPVFSPNARRIAWASTRGNDVSYIGVDEALWSKELRSELWIMDIASGRRQQLTFFNQKGHEHCASAKGAYVCMAAWHPKYDNVIAIVLNCREANYETSKILLLELGVRK